MAESTAVVVKDGDAARRIQNDKVYQEYCSLAGTRPDEELIPHIAKMYGLKPKYVNDLILRRTGAGSFQTLRFSEAQLIQSIAAFDEQVADAINFYDEELDKLAAAEGQGQTFVDVEETRFEGLKDKSITTKGVSITTARQRLLELKMEARARFFNAVSKVTPKTINIVQDNALQGRSLAELDIIEAKLKAKKFIEDKRHEEAAST